MKDNNKNAHWVGHSKLKPLDKDGFQNKFIDYIQASLTGTTIEQSASGRKNNPHVLKEYEEQEAEEANSDADVISKEKKINEYNKCMIISMEEYQKTLKYQ